MARHAGPPAPAGRRPLTPPTIRPLVLPASAVQPTAVQTESAAAGHVMLTPPAPCGTGHRDHRRARVHGPVGRVTKRLPRMTRGRALVLLTVSVVAVLGVLTLGTTLTAAATPGTPQHAATASTPTAPPVLPIPTAGTCPPNSPLPVCAPPTAPSSNGVPLPIGPGTTVPVTCFPGSIAPECLAPSGTPLPATPTGVAPPPSTGDGSSGGGDSGDGSGDSCGLFDITGCFGSAIDNFFDGIVSAALNPLLDLLGQTLLSTPTPGSLPEVGALWTSSWQIMLACYGILVLIGAILVMAYGTVQNRHSFKEIAPRVVAGFFVGALSLTAASEAIDLANGLAQAVLGGGVDPASAGNTLKTIVMHDVAGGLFFILLGLVLAVLLVILAITYIVRVALTIILIAGAPILLMGHALPQTDGVARWWWKAFGGCLAIQVGQSLALVTAMRVFLAPGGFVFFGPNVNGLVNILVAMALIYVLIKIPFWFLGSLRGGSGRSLLGSVARGFLTYKTLGLLGGLFGGGGHKRSARRKPARAPDPYKRVKATSTGQYMLPLPGLKRGKAPMPPHRRYPARGATKPFGPRRAPSGVQLTLPLGDDWPENKPVLGHDGQYRLPLDVERVTPVAPSPPPPPSPPGSRRGGRRGGQQLQFEFDPYRGNRPTSSGQYPLPLNVTRTPRPASTPQPKPPAAPSRSGSRGTQLELPFDPYKGNRPTRSGQYPLPLDGVRRVPPAPPAKPAPAAPPVPPTPAPPTKRSATRSGRQLRLPLDLPKLPKPPTPPRRTPSPKRTSGGTR